MARLYVDSLVYQNPINTLPIETCVILIRLLLILFLPRLLFPSRLLVFPHPITPLSHLSISFLLVLSQQGGDDGLVVEYQDIKNMDSAAIKSLVTIHIRWRRSPGCWNLAMVARNYKPQPVVARQRIQILVT